MLLTNAKSPVVDIHEWILSQASTTKLWCLSYLVLTQDLLTYQILGQRSWWVHMHTHYRRRWSNTFHIYMIEVGSSLKWLTVQPKPWSCGAFPTQGQPRTLAYLPWSGPMFVLAIESLWIHLHHHCRRRQSNTFHMYKIEVGASLKWMATSTM